MTAARQHGRDPCQGPDYDPKRPDNRAGLDTIAYRIGTHSALLNRMLWRLPRTPVRDDRTGADALPLAALTARDTSDPTVALIDAWAAALDVLSFHSERIAQEGYIRTAVERRSMVELARTIGYEMAPGVAASAHLAFTVEGSDDPYRAVQVPAGLQAMSVPQANGELPQIFETLETILARAEWNAIPAQTTRVQNIALFHDPDDEDRSGRLFLIDVDNSFDLDALPPDAYAVLANEADLANYYPLSETLDLATALTNLQEDAAFNAEIDPTLRAVEVNETYLAGVGLNLPPGARILAVGARREADGTQVVQTAALKVLESEAMPAFRLTRVVAVPIDATDPPVRLTAPVLQSAQLRIGTVQLQPTPLNATTVATSISRASWTGDTLNAYLSSQLWARQEVMEILRQPTPAPTPALGDARPGFYALRETAGFFGNSAPRHETLADPSETRGGTAKDPYPESWDSPTDGSGPRTVWTDSQGVLHVDAQAYLEREILNLPPDGWAVFETPLGKTTAFRVAAAGGASLADYTLNAKATGLQLRTAANQPLDIDPDALGELGEFRFRTARAHVKSERLAPAGAPITEDLAAGATEVALDNLYLDLEPGRSISISGERADAPGVFESETIEIADVLHVGGLTRVVLAAGAAHGYRRPTVRLNANVALASHGEFYEEALGSGDAAKANQSFALAKTPLTFVSAATETGRASTLTVRVDGIAWAEVGSLYDAGPTDEVYQVRIDDDGTTRVVFGDGAHGRRLPTGRLNVTAAYRSGIGVLGEVPDEAIIQLKTRPLGIRAVVNPSPATGSAEPETLEDARVRGPDSVRVLGRIVSLTDYEDFARIFAGIGKARAAALWSGTERIAHLTVAPEAEGVFEATATTLVNLTDAVETVRNRGPRVIVAPHVGRFFRIEARLTFDPRYLADDVDAAARGALTAGYGYHARDLAAPVSAAEVVTTLQGVEGVVAVDLDALALYDESDADAPAGLANVLPARAARIDAATGDVLAAELLTLLPSGATLVMESADG